MSVCVCVCAHVAVCMRNFDAVFLGICVSEPVSLRALFLAESSREL